MFCMHDLHACCKAQNPLDYPENALAVHVVPWLLDNILTPQHANFNESLVPAFLRREMMAMHQGRHGPGQVVGAEAPPLEDDKS